ncbi:MAG: YfdX family protein [Methylobacter sp.]|nr:YfdX family protein [Methylobacter sp.]
MKKYFHKIATYTALVLISSLSLPVDVFADAEKKQTPSIFSTIDKSTAATKRKILAEKEQQIVDEANEAVLGTQQALKALEKNDSKKAISILRTVSGKLDIILAKNPALALIPADIEFDVSDFQGDAKTVEKAIGEADDLLGEGKLQDARQILAQLASEIRVSTINIPLGSFPTAIKDAVALIDTGKSNEAADVLNKVLNMLVETTEVFPLPILRAETLLDEASELENKKDLSKEKSREEILKLADAAKDELKLAELLGYGNKDDYKVLYTEIDVVKETLHSEKSSATWEKIKRTLSELKNKVMHTKKSSMA